MLDDFKEFIMRGNVVDMAVGIIIGGAFAIVVQSLVDDIIMPPIGLLLGGVDFSSLFVTLGPGSYPSLAAAKEAGAATINYGLFISNLITFLIVGFSVYLLVWTVQRLQPEDAPEPTTRKCPECLSEIPVAARRCAFCTTLLDANSEG